MTGRRMWQSETVRSGKRRQALDRLGVIISAVAICGLAQQSARANCYPTGLTLSGTTITSCTPAGINFILNETADGTPAVTIKVKKASDNSVIRTVTFPAGDPMATKGAHSFTWDKKDDASNPAPDLTAYYFEITTKALGHTTWTMISTDTTNNNFGTPRGVAVNRTPSSPYYGRIYVSNGSTTTGLPLSTAKGLYMRNADLSDSPIGQGGIARTGGVDWYYGNASSPFRLTIGADDQVYITDWSNQHGGLWVADPDINAATQLLGSVGGGSGFTGATNGAISGMNVLGTLAGGNLKIYSMDQDHGGSPNFQTVWRYDIGAGPLPWLGGPTLGQPNQQMTSYMYTWPYTGAGLTGNYVSDGNATNGGWLSTYEGVGSGDDIDIAPDGKIFICESRANGLGSGLLVFSADPGTGQSTLLYDSLYDTRNNIQLNVSATDILNSVIAVAVSADGTQVAAMTTTQVIVIPLFQSGPNQGLPDLRNRVIAVPTFTSSGRDVCWDAAGNLYSLASGTARLRIYSPPTGPNMNTTASAAFTLNGVGSGGPTINTQPQSQSVCLNTNATFTVSASGSGTLSYQWYRNTVPMDGATNSSLTVLADNVNAVSGDSYTVSICDVNGVKVSNTATLTIYSVPAITGNPYDLAVYPGQSASYTAAGTSGAPGGVTYQWYKSPSTALPGQTSGTLALSNVSSTDAGSYFLRVTDSCGRTADSYAGKLTVLQQPCNAAWADADGNGAVDMDDFAAFQLCYTGDSGTGFDSEHCHCFDRGGNNAVDSTDFDAFQACSSGPGVPASTDGACAGSIVLYTQNFDADDTANWTVNKATGANANDPGNIAEIFYDYSLIGVPSAPHSVGSTTRGLRLRANAVAPSGTITLTGLSVSPTGQSFTGDYIVRFDAWMNFNGPLPTGAAGSSQITEFGFGTGGTIAQIPGALGGGAIDSVFFACGGDGQNGADYRAYCPAVIISYQDGDPVYAAGAAAGGYGSRNALHPYYTQWFGGTVENNFAPAGQLSQYPAQTGHTAAGATGFKWRDMMMIKSGTTAVWLMDGHLIATVNLSTAGTLGGGNILFGQSDVNASAVAANLNELVFGLIDNVTVTRN